MTDLRKTIADWRKDGTQKNGRNWCWEQDADCWVLLGILIADLEDGTPGGDAADRANAALIAAAPDMADRIERLEILLTEIRDLRVDRRDHVTMDEAEAVMPWASWEAVLDDIEKALGEPE